MVAPTMALPSTPFGAGACRVSATCGSNQVRCLFLFSGDWLFGG